MYEIFFVSVTDNNISDSWYYAFNDAHIGVSRGGLGGFNFPEISHLDKKNSNCLILLSFKVWLNIIYNNIDPVSYTHLDVYKRQVLRYRQQSSSLLLKFVPGLFGRSPSFLAKPDVSKVLSTGIISENRVRKREVVYVSDHSTVVKAEELSSFYGNISFRIWF